MAGRAVQWLIVIASLGVVVFIVVIGMSLLPTRLVAGERGITAQWLLTWIMIGATTLTALTLAGFLVVKSVGKHS